MNLPPDFISTITNTFGADGETLIANLPALIKEASARWELTNVRPVDNLSYNFVAFARRGEVFSPHDKTNPQTIGRGDPAPTWDVVLKIGVPRDELTSEIAALRLFNGDGACQLIDADEEKGFLLLERLHPGVMLSTLEDDDESTRIAAEVMKRIWRPVESDGLPSNVREQAPALQSFIKLSDWFDGLKRLRETYNGGTGPLNAKLVERVEASTRDFFSENHMPVLMHGDFHHYNILSSERGWLIIDPKGVSGPAGYEVGPFMLNPWGSFSDGISRRVMERRVDMFHELLDFERQRVIEWSLAHAILSAWWSLDENTGWEYAAQRAELFGDLK